MARVLGAAESEGAMAVVCMGDKQKVSETLIQIG